MISFFALDGVCFLNVRWKSMFSWRRGFIYDDTLPVVIWHRFWSSLLQADILITRGILPLSCYQPVTADICVCGKTNAVWSHVWHQIPYDVTLVSTATQYCDLPVTHFQEGSKQKLNKNKGYVRNEVMCVTGGDRFDQILILPLSIVDSTTSSYDALTTKFCMCLDAILKFKKIICKFNVK